jgi:hypothetical protein
MVQAAGGVKVYVNPSGGIELFGIKYILEHTVPEVVDVQSEIVVRVIKSE